MIKPLMKVIRGKHNTLRGKHNTGCYTVVEVTTFREGREFKDLDYHNEEKRIEKLIDAKGTFILWSRKDIIVTTHLSPIVSPRSTKVGGTPTSNMLMPA
jgi:hypothetical protein